jgi:uncharacterized coiled-coil protein SlyX
MEMYKMNFRQMLEDRIKNLEVLKAKNDHTIKNLQQQIAGLEKEIVYMSGKNEILTDLVNEYKQDFKWREENDMFEE